MVWISWRNMKPWLKQVKGAFRGASLPADFRVPCSRGAELRKQVNGSDGSYQHTCLYKGRQFCVFQEIIPVKLQCMLTLLSLCWRWVLHSHSRVECSHSGCDAGFWLWLFLGKGRGEYLQPRYRSRWCSWWVGRELPPVCPRCLAALRGLISVPALTLAREGAWGTLCGATGLWNWPYVKCFM